MFCIKFNFWLSFFQLLNFQFQHSGTCRCTELVYKFETIFTLNLLLTGSYSTGNQSYCISCQPGTFCPNTTTDANIANCAAGSYSYVGYRECTRCPAGWECSEIDGSGNAPCLKVGNDYTASSYYQAVKKYVWAMFKTILEQLRVFKGICSITSNVCTIVNDTLIWQHMWAVFVIHRPTCSKDHPQFYNTGKLCQEGVYAVGGGKGSQYLK